MTKYIDKTALIAEIKRLENDEFLCDSYDEATGFQSALRMVQEFIDTLEVKGVNNVWNNASDFPKAEDGRSILLIEDNGHTELLQSPSAERLFYFRPTNLKMWAYVDELLSMITLKEVDLEKEAENFVKTGEFAKTESPVLTIARHFFELGLKAQKGE